MKFRRFGAPIKLNKSKANGECQQVIVQLNSGSTASWTAQYRWRMRFFFFDEGIALVQTREGLDVHDEEVIAVNVYGYYDFFTSRSTTSTSHVYLQEDLIEKQYGGSFEKFFEKFSFYNKPYDGCDLPGDAEYHVQDIHGEELGVPINRPQRYYINESGKEVKAKSWQEWREGVAKMRERESRELAVRLMTIGIHEAFRINSKGILIVRSTHSAIAPAAKKAQKSWPSREKAFIKAHRDYSAGIELQESLKKKEDAAERRKNKKQG